MRGRRRHSGGQRLGARWFAVCASLALAAGAAAVAMAPADATPIRTDGTTSTTTVNAQLSLSGVATKDNMLGGTTVGVHPGDTVVFTASATPTAGLQNIPLLGSMLTSLLDPLLGQYQVVLSLGSNFPGGARTVTVGGPTSGACKGQQSVPVTFPSAGTYAFTWTVQYVAPLLFGCSKDGLNSTDLNLLKSAGIAINAYNQWTGQVVAADNPPPTGLSIQLPGVGAAPSLPGVGQLPTVGVPPIALPTIPVTIPSLPGLPGGGTSTPPGGGSTPPSDTDGGREVDGVQTTIPDLVVPKGPGISVPGVQGWQVPMPGKARGVAPGVASPSASASSDLPTADAPSQTKQIELAASPTPGPQMPVILAIIAIIALALVTALYARLYLLRKV